MDPNASSKSEAKYGHCCDGALGGGRGTLSVQIYLVMFVVML